MTGKYVSVAIDHGTTNSCIAHMSPDGPKIVKIGNWDTMPSAVYLDHKGGERIGQEAVSAMMLTSQDKGEGYTGYKRFLGQNRQYKFHAANRDLTAPELGAKVIAKLLAAYEEAESERLRSCVITIPAMFEDSANAGTRKAAALAGLEYSPFIMEPIAAATRFGFSRQPADERWIVFDLGGGTLDVSLLTARGGTLIVPEEGHSGDTDLGGRKFDTELFNYVKDQLCKTYQLDDLSEGNPTYRAAWGKLMLAVEKAKIELSTATRSETRVEVEDLCLDGRGNLVQVDVPVTRSHYEKLIAPYLEKAVTICRNLLEKNRLTADRIARLILIGGPTKTPLLRKVLEAQLKIRLDHTFDPMTAVAEGAAIFADTVEKPYSTVAQAGTGEQKGPNLKLQYERQSAMPQYTIAGQVERCPDGGTVEIRRSDGEWLSGKVPVDTDGFFTVELLLKDEGKPHLSRFNTTLFGAKGEILASQSEPEIWYPYPATQNRLAVSIRVGTHDNKTITLLKRGVELPKDGCATGNAKVRTVKVLKKGSADDVIRIPILCSITNLQGSEDEHADCCTHQGTITIFGNDRKVTRDVPAGTEVDVTIRVDESRKILATAYIDFLEQEFGAEFKEEAYKTNLPTIEQHFADVKLALFWKERTEKANPTEIVGKTLENLKTMKTISLIEQNLERARKDKNDMDALHRAYKGVLELASTANELGVQQRPARIAHMLETLRPVLSPGYQQTFDDLDAAFRKAQPDSREMEQIEMAVDELENEIRGSAWSAVLLNLELLSGRKVDSRQGELFKQADKLTADVIAAGGYRTATATQLRELQRLHADMLSAYPTLADERQKAIAAKAEQQGGRRPKSEVTKS